ncbi:hypothetical protein PW52_05050 [Tamlana sedimentorum]|uniref:Beta-galactosidase n=1 Tax=Neotamlana sedimentorum TaxID=1435349 RepID=A0A0D7W9Z6_9FLAO|nr:hypothetical protein PW52_05050 [Tamlana sedimentorum]
MRKIILLLIIFIQASIDVTANVSTEDNNPIRKEINLNGLWEIKVGNSKNFVDIQVPSSYAGQNLLWGKEHWDVWGYPTNWKNKEAVYKRSISIPKDTKGQQILLRFEGVRHTGRIEINGKEVGKWEDSYIPFEFDITDYVDYGNENELLVFVDNKNTSGLFEDYNFNRRGIYRDVTLKFVPKTRVVSSEVYIQTSVSKNTLTYEVPLLNNSKKKQDIKLRFKVQNSEGKIVKTWDYKENISLLPSEMKKITTSEIWNEAHLWSIDDPYLHFITTEVLNKKGKLIDSHQLRFGFREITWKKHHLYLNGNEVFLRGHGGHSFGDLQGGKEYTRAWLTQLKDQGVEAMRLHNMPRHLEIYDAADEMGFLLISEAAHHFRLPSKEKGLSHMEALIKWLRNRPSIMMWSVANELHWRNFEEPVYLIELSRKLDPTRPAFNSDFSKWSRHGDVISHHYAPEKIWTDWEEFGPEKVMIWDEIGSVWQHDRPLKTGPAGIEISSQDVATGIWRDGWEMMRNDIEVFADGKMINNALYRVNAFFPWELSYNFFRFQPINNFQRFYPKYEQKEGVSGIQPLFINPGATPINIWDPTLPKYIANPAFYCFNEYLARVRFPDDSKHRTFFSEETITFDGRLFFEDHRPADKVEFRVETPEGKVLTSSSKDISLKAGEYKKEFHSQWTLPKVDDVTEVRLVRQFSNKGNIGYRKITEAKIFPNIKAIDLISKKVAVIGKALQEILGGSGVPISTANIIVSESYDASWDKYIAKGTRVLIQSTQEKLNSQNKIGQAVITIRGKSKHFTGSVKNLKLAKRQTMNFGAQEKVKSIMNGKSLTIENPAPGTWLTFGFPGLIDFSQTSKIQLDYGLWENPRKDGYQKQWTNNGGAPFYEKKFKILVSDTSGEWFVSDGDNGTLAMERKDPFAFNDLLKLDCSTFSWKPVKFENGKIVENNNEVKINLTGIVAVGILFTETNPKSRVQIKSLDIRGGSLPNAYVQPGSNKHLLLENLGQEDFSFWRGGSSLQSIPFPESLNTRRILFGNKDGSKAALQETFIGKGVLLESALNIQNNKEPMAGFLLNRMLNYLDGYKPSKDLGKVHLIGNGFLSNWLKKMDIDEVSNISKTSKTDIIVVEANDAIELSKNKKDLSKHLKSGGTILFSQVSPESIELIREITGRSLQLTEPYFEQRFKCIKAPVSWQRIGTPKEYVDYYEGVLVPYPFEPNLNPLLSGIANIDLDWNSKEMFKYGIEIKDMNPVYAVEDHQILISNWHIGSEPTNHLYGEQLNGVRDLRQNSWFVNRDPVVMELKAKGGRVLISQLDLKAGGEKSHRILQTLMTNLGVSFNGALPISTDKVYDLSLQKAQIERFKVYDKQIASVKREYYGIPKVMPDYLEGTKIAPNSSGVELPTLLFVGDPVTLSLNYATMQTLEGVVKTLGPINLDNSKNAAKTISENIGKNKIDRVVFSIGENNLDSNITDQEFFKYLEDVWKILNKKSNKIYWTPIPSEFGKNKKKALVAKRLNAIAEKYFEEKKEVYVIPFVYKDVSSLPAGYLSGKTKEFSTKEARILAKRLANAIISFGAQ